MKEKEPYAHRTYYIVRIDNVAEIPSPAPGEPAVPVERFVTGVRGRYGFTRRQARKIARRTGGSVMRCQYL